MKTNCSLKPLIIFTAISILPTVAAAKLPQPLQTPSSPQSSAVCTPENLVGVWKNDIDSVMRIKKIEALKNTPDGLIFSGSYVSPSGTDSQQNQMFGTANYSKPKADKKDNALVLTFNVNWGKFGSVTAWTGTCRIKDGKPFINTVWNLARPNTDYHWDHVFTGYNYFKKTGDIP